MRAGGRQSPHRAWEKHERKTCGTGYGRLFFRYGKGLSASLKHLTVDGKTPADVGHPSITLTLKESVALVRYFNGVLCAPAAKIDIPRGRDVWLMLLAPINNSPRIDVSKSLLVAEKASVSASLSAGEEDLRYSLNAYGSGFKRAGLELVKRINTGTSLTHGLERITVKQRLAEAKPGETIQSTWTPSRGPTEPVLVVVRSFLFHEGHCRRPPSPWMQRPQQPLPRPKHNAKPLHSRRRRAHRIQGEADSERENSR
jgi:hypothetical protein